MIPASVKTILWSYDSSKIDLNKDKKTIVGQVLNFGSEEGVLWLFATYGKDEIARIASTIPSTTWDRKSLKFWSLVLQINPPSKRLIA